MQRPTATTILLASGVVPILALPGAAAMFLFGLDDSRHISGDLAVIVATIVAFVLAFVFMMRRTRLRWLMAGALSGVGLIAAYWFGGHVIPTPGLAVSLLVLWYGIWLLAFLVAMVVRFGYRTAEVIDPVAEELPLET